MLNNSLFAMAVQLTGEEFEIIRDLFKVMDKDGDGKITVSEFKEHINKAKTCGQDEKDTDEYVNFLMRVYDIDGNGSLEFPEFLQIDAFITFEKKPTEEYIKQLFKALDKDDKGFISAEDIKRFCRIFKSVDDVPYDETNVDNLITMLDINGDGEINYNEFITNYYVFKKFEDDD